jgi:hypothetical protein
LLELLLHLLGNVLDSNLDNEDFIESLRVVTLYEFFYHFQHFQSEVTVLQVIEDWYLSCELLIDSEFGHKILENECEVALELMECGTCGAEHTSKVFLVRFNVDAGTHISIWPGKHHLLWFNESLNLRGFERQVLLPPLYILDYFLASNLWVPRGSWKELPNLRVIVTLQVCGGCSGQVFAFLYQRIESLSY